MQGPSGEDGMDGAQGLRGFNGTNGINGTQGQQGITYINSTNTYFRLANSTASQPFQGVFLTTATPRCDSEDLVINGGFTANLLSDAVTVQDFKTRIKWLVNNFKINNCSSIICIYSNML